MNGAFKRISLLALVGMYFLSVITLTGCATQKGMALNSRTKTVTLTRESIGLFTLRTANNLVPDHQPKVIVFEVISEGPKRSTINFKVDKPSSQEKKKFVEYLVSMQLPPGTYSTGLVVGDSEIPLLIHGYFSFPMGTSFELPPNAVVYLGHVDMVNRQRKEGERRSGSVIPLIDQAATGFSNGTFDASVSDRSDVDIRLFKEKYPCLANCSITTAVMKK